MNNYELHEKAQELADTKTPYSLARELIELQNDLNNIKSNDKQQLNCEIFAFIKKCGELADDFAQEDTYLYDRARKMSYEADELLIKIQESQL